MRRHGRGEILALEGGPPEEVVVIRRGRVKVTYTTAQGREVLLAVGGPGAVLGELSAIDGMPRTATVTAIDDVELIAVPASDFTTFLSAHPDTALALLRTLSQRLRESDAKRVEQVESDVQGRLARLLLQLVDDHGAPHGDGGVRIALPLSQEEMAAWTGASREAVNKALARLRAQGWVATQRREIVVLDVAALQRAVEGPGPDD
jgi:CRP-like cAMP-binding protein